jgi:hypothetical protein
VCLVETAPAIFHRPFRYRPAFFGHPVEPQFLRFGEVERPATPDDVFLVLDGLAHFLGTIGFEPIPHIGTEGV